MNLLFPLFKVRVTLEENEGFAITSPYTYTVVIPSGEAFTVTYKVAAFVLGSVPLQGNFSKWHLKRGVISTNVGSECLVDITSAAFPD